MAMRHEELSAEEVARQDGLNRSWAAAQRALADPTFRASLEKSIERVNQSSSADVLTPEEFLAQTDSSLE